MRIGVIISYQDTMDYHSWVDDTDAQDKCITNWDERVNSIITRFNTEKDCYPVEVFLCIPRDCDFWEQLNELKSYLNLVQRHTYLLNETYLVLDRRVGKEIEIDSEALANCFNKLQSLYLCDILQADVGISAGEIEEGSFKILKSLVTFSKNRKKILEQMLAGPADWKFDLHWVIYELEPFLYGTPNLLSDDEGLDDLNIVIVLEGNWGNKRKQIIKFIEAKTERQKIAICTTNVDDELEDFARGNNLDILKFSGFFDLRYFLQSYDYLKKEADNVVGSDAYTEELFFDKKSHDRGGEIFVKTRYSSNVTSLITSAFDPKDFSVYNYMLNPLASRATFDLFKDHRGKKFVLPIVSPNNLKEHLNAIPPNVLVWTHFGHGKEGHLQGFGSTYSSSQAWLESFQGLGINLRLAFFFSCDSAKVAEAFRDAGVRIAIGFASKVLMEDCIRMAKIIIPLALNGGSDTDIFEVFKERCKTLGSDYRERCKPQIFIST